MSFEVMDDSASIFSPLWTDRHISKVLRETTSETPEVSSVYADAVRRLELVPDMTSKKLRQPMELDGLGLLLWGHYALQVCTPGSNKLHKF